jgi:hypothetical protein
MSLTVMLFDKMAHINSVMYRASGKVHYMKNIVSPFVPEYDA